MTNPYSSQPENTPVQIHIQNFILVQTGTYQEQMIRPFTTNIQHQHLEALERVTQGGRNLGVGAIEQVASGMLHPDSQPEAIAGISQGWRSRRFRFIMRVDQVNAFNPHERTQRIYYGYTDNCDASYNHLDPQMRIYFNSETVVRSFTRSTPNGIVVEPMVVGSNQIVSPLETTSSGEHNLFNRPVSFMIRPEDVFLNGQVRHIAEKMAYSGILDKNKTLEYDERSLTGQHGKYKYSRRRDTTPSRYLSDSLKAYKHAVAEASLEGNYDTLGDREVLYGEAHSHVTNQDINGNAFFALLRQRTGFMERGYVTFRELCVAFPEVASGSVVNYSMDDGRSIRRVNFVEHSEHWRGSDNVTMAATMIAQTVPAIMMDNFIRSISFAATNAMGGMGYTIDVHDNIRSVIDGINLIPYIEEFTRRLELDILRSITMNGQLGFRLSVSSDLAGDSVIDIELDGEPMRRYVAPTFTDSLFTPIVTNQYTRQKTIADDILFVLEQTIQTQPAAQSTYQPLATPHQHQTQPVNKGYNNDFYSELL